MNAVPTNAHAHTHTTAVITKIITAANIARIGNAKHAAIGVITKTPTATSIIARIVNTMGVISTSSSDCL